MSDLPPRRRSTPFRPRFTLMVVYVFGFFLLFALVFVGPQLFEVVRLAGRLPPEELEKRAFEISRQSFQGRFFLAAGASVVTTALGAWWRALPGLRA